MKSVVISREEATSALQLHMYLVFMRVLISWLNQNLEMSVFVERGKPENPEKNPQSKARTNNKLNPHTLCGTGSELNQGHVGGRQTLSLQCHPCAHAR